MQYDCELTFARKVLKNMQLNSYIITKNHFSDEIDLGLRKHLGINQDREKTIQKLNSIIENNTVTVVTDEFLCNYILFPLPDTSDNAIFICGPYITEDMTKQKLMENAEIHNISPHMFTQFSRYYGNITHISDTSYLFALISVIGETIWGNDNSFSIKKHRKQIKDTEYEINIGKLNDVGEESALTVNLIESRYEAERIMMDAVSRGQAHKIAHLLSHTSEFVFENRIDDKIRNTKNYMIVMNTLLRKAVQDSGVPPYFIDKISSEFARKIEAVSGGRNIELLASEMIEKYNNLAREHSHGKYSPAVQKAMAIADCDLTADLSLKTISGILGINESYFSSLFRKETGKTFTDFINGKRIEHAKKLLRSTSLQIQTIAQHCGILDVNYFTKLFRKYTGTTPGKFRTKS